MDTAPETAVATAVEEPMYEWSTLPWTQVERQVFKLQTRIYRASKRGDHCHDGKTAGDGSSAVRGARDNRAR